MKKAKIITAIILTVVIAFAALGIEHYYGDNIYWAVKYGDKKVVKISDDEYRAPKDEPDNFIEYLKENGYEEYDQMGAEYILVRDDEKVYFLIHFKEFYAEWTLDGTEKI